MWAVLLLLSCIIYSIGCSIFDENQASEYDDFHDGSYSYSDDDDDYEDEYTDPVSTEQPRVRRYDRVTHTVPAPLLTIGLPEVKDALQMLMIGRNLSSTDIKDLEAGRSQFVYPIEMKFEATVSNAKVISSTKTEESLEIPIEFYEIKVPTEALLKSSREKELSSREHPMEPPRTYHINQPTRDLLTHTTAKQHTVDRPTNTTVENPTRLDFIDMQNEIIPFDSKNIARDRLNFFNNPPQQEPIINSSTESTRATEHALRELMLGRNLKTNENPPVEVCNTTVKIDGEYIDEPTLIQNEVTYIGNRPNRQDYINVRDTKLNFTERVKMEPVMKAKDTITVKQSLFKLKQKPNNVEYYIIEGPNKNIKEVPTRIGFDEQIDKMKYANRKPNKNTSANPTRNEIVEKKTEIEYITGRPTRPLYTKPTRNEFFEHVKEKVYIIEKSTENLKQETTGNLEDKTEMEYMIQESTETITIMKPIRIEYTGQTNEITYNIKLEKPTRSDFFQHVNEEVYIFEKSTENVKQETTGHIEDKIEMEYMIEESPKTTTIKKPTRVEYTEQINEITHNTKLDKPTRSDFFQHVNEEVYNIIEKPTENVKQETTRHIEDETEMEYMIEESTKTITIMKPTRVEYTGQTNEITHNAKLEKPTRNQILSDKPKPKGFQSTSIKQPTELEPNQNMNSDEKTVIETIEQNLFDLAFDTRRTSDNLFDETIIELVSYTPLRTQSTFETTSDSLLENTSVTNENKFNKYSKQITEEEYTIEEPISIDPSIFDLINKPLRVDSQKTSTSKELFKIIPKAYSNRTEVSVTAKTRQLQRIFYYDDTKSGVEVYTDSDSNGTNLLQTPPVALPMRSKAETFQTVFLYENDVPQDDVILRMDDDKEDDNDGVMVAGNWSEEYDPLEFLLTDDNFNILRGSGNQSSSNSTTPKSSNTKSKKKKKPKKTTNATTTAYPFDVEKFLELVANLTYDYYTNLTQELNETLKFLGAPTCPTPTTVTTTTTTEATRYQRPDYSMMENKIMGKCYVCGLVDEGIPWNAHCSDAFAGDFLPLSPVDASAKGNLAKYRKYCRYDDVDHYVVNETTPRTIFGRWTGGCGVRWTDISSIYTQRTCRNRNHPTTGKHYASKRMSKLEMALANTENGCIVSPAASLIPLSRGISLYARFHACVCTGTWCNVSWRLDSDRDVWMTYVIVVLLVVLR